MPFAAQRPMDLVENWAVRYIRGYGGIARGCEEAHLGKVRRSIRQADLRPAPCDPALRAADLSPLFVFHERVQVSRL